MASVGLTGPVEFRRNVHWIVQDTVLLRLTAALERIDACRRRAGR